MALCFGVGSACFVIGPFPGYAQLVGGKADAITFFVGSIFFTVGGGVQSWLAWPDRHHGRTGKAAWWVAITQSAGTLFFNVTTATAINHAFSNPSYDRLVWRPDAYGSACFLVSGLIAYVVSPRRRLRPIHHGRDWWAPAVNLLGCLLFAVSAVAGYVVPSQGSVLALAAANWTTSLGGACFLACAVGSLR